MKTGRFLCVREELRRKIEEEEADESELQSSWLSRVVLHRICRFEDWRKATFSSPKEEAFPFGFLTICGQNWHVSKEALLR